MPGHMHGGFGRGGGGWGGGGYRGWGGGWGGGRRIGYPLLGGGFGMGGLGGGGLLSDLLSGGVGYLMGKNSAQNQPYPPQYQQPAPQYQQDQQPQYQQPAPQYQPSSSPGSAAGNTPDNRLVQLRQLGQLREQGVLTDEEFQAEKQRILNG